jgi:hypothetical protein
MVVVVESILCQDRVLHSARKKRKKRKENNSSRRQRQSLSFRRSYIFPRPRFSDSNRTYHSPSRVNTRRLRLHSCRQLSSIVISSLHNESNERHGYECTVPVDIARHKSSPEHLSKRQSSYTIVPLTRWSSRQRRPRMRPRLLANVPTRACDFRL